MVHYYLSLYPSRVCYDIWAVAMNYGDILKRDGAVVVPFLGGERVDEVHEGLLQEMRAYPEYREGAGEGVPLVLGGFGALGNPSSFHSATVRGVRVAGRAVAEGVFRGMYQEGTVYLEQLMDRVCVRRAGKALPPDSWHRDVVPEAVKLPGEDGTLAKGARAVTQEEAVFGGWVNLNRRGGKTQKFVFVPGSHGTRGSGQGFAPIPKEEHEALDKAARVLEVPPGHLLVFYQHIVHKVAAVTYKEDCLRLFMGWAISRVCAPMFGAPYLEQVLGQFQAPLLPSGQRPAMYSANCMSVRQRGTIAWSQRAMRRSLLVRKWPKGKRPYKILPRFLLRVTEEVKARGSGFFVPYTEEDKAAIWPRALHWAPSNSTRCAESKERIFSAIICLSDSDDDDNDEPTYGMLTVSDSESETDNGSESETDSDSEMDAGDVSDGSQLDWATEAREAEELEKELKASGRWDGDRNRRINAVIDRYSRKLEKTDPIEYRKMLEMARA
jgi:hypothetical protein